jgi:hypothetical protein
MCQSLITSCRTGILFIYGGQFFLRFVRASIGVRMRRDELVPDGLMATPIIADCRDCIATMGKSYASESWADAKSDWCLRGTFGRDPAAAFGVGSYRLRPSHH